MLASERYRLGNGDHHEGQVKVSNIHRSRKQHPSIAEAHGRGFTLIELLIVLAIVAIMAAFAVPAFTHMIRSQKVVTASNELMSAMSLARSEAITRGASVTICATDDPNAVPTACAAGLNWEDGWLIFVTAAGEAAPLTVGMPISGITMIAPGPNVVFDNRGIPMGGGGALAVNAEECVADIDKKVDITLHATGLISSAASYSAAGDCP